MYKASADDGNTELRFTTFAQAHRYLVRAAIKELDRSSSDEDKEDWGEFVDELIAESGKFTLQSPDGYEYSVVTL